ncbi:MAG: CorA family divalent cation transporter [Candidatus Norongarragalinales archaeon]
MIETFTDFAQFKKKAQEIGVGVNLDELLAVDIVFLESYEDYLIISVKDYSQGPSNGLSSNILILSEKNVLLYSEKTFGEKDYKMFRFTLQKQFGESTVLTLLTLRDIFNNYQNAFKTIDEKIDALEIGYDLEEAESTTIRLRKVANRIEDLVNLLVSLEERKIRQVDTSLVAYDYRLLLTKARHLLDRCRNHLNQLRDIQREADMRQTRETNKRIEDLTNVMKKLTSITVILMLPTLVASHYGMNFSNMPELQLTWAYPAVIGVEIALAVLAAVYFRKRGWI